MQLACTAHVPRHQAPHQVGRRQGIYPGHVALRVTDGDGWGLRRGPVWAQSAEGGGGEAVGAGGGGGGGRRVGHEATDTGLAYAPVSQAHGHHHTQFNVLPCCTAAQTSSVVDSHAPLWVAFECALAVWASGSARFHHPPTAPVSL